jgi:outer membrane protein TolC
MSELRRWAAIAACVLGSGCIPTLVENPAREVSKAVPKSFRQGEEPASDETVGKKNWKDFFASAELQNLISTALQNNQELNVRLQEIIIAQTEISARRGEYLPKLKAGLGTGIEKVGGYTSQGFSDKATGVPENLGNFGFGLQASWEIDVWGKLRNAAQSADYRWQASIGGKNFMVTQLVAEIARSYYELIALDNQLEVLKRNIKIQQDALEVVKIEKQAARVTQLAVQRFEAEVLKNRSRLYDLEQERVQAENRINFLVGRYPQPVARNPDAMKDPLPPVLAAGLPRSCSRTGPTCGRPSWSSRPRSSTSAWRARTSTRR